MTAATVTTDPPAPAIRPLGADDAGAAARLSALCNWNQTAADWRLMCGLGRAYGIDGANGALKATALSLPYDAGFGWISGPADLGGRGLPRSFEGIYGDLESRYQIPDQGCFGIGLGMDPQTLL